MHFTNTSAGDFTTRQWDFGDGATSTETNPTHTYTVPGTYAVALTVGDGTDTSTITKPGYIVAKRSTYLPVVMRNLDPYLYDGFSDTAWDGAFNPAKWQFQGEAWAKFQQGNGSLIVWNTTLSTEGGGGLLARTPLPRSPQRLWWVEAHVKMSSDRTGGWSSVQPKAHATVNGHGWIALCSLGGSQGQPTARFDCGILVPQGSGWTHEYSSPSVSVPYDTWHTARIEILPNTAEVRFYLDNSLLGQHIPVDAGALKNVTSMWPALDLWNGDLNATSTRYVDDMRITPAH